MNCLVSQGQQLPRVPCSLARRNYPTAEPLEQLKDLVACLDLRVTLRVQAQRSGTTACFGLPGMLWQWALRLLCRRTGPRLPARHHQNSNIARGAASGEAAGPTCRRAAILCVVSQALHGRLGW